MKNLFYLQKDISFLNHGSFGACPVPVMDEYRKWQIELEKQPVAFMQRRLSGLLAENRKALAEFLSTSPNRLAFVPNATTALNIVAHSIDLAEADEVLTTNLEYGAMDRMWEMICERKKARYVRAKIPLPLETVTFEQAILEQMNSKTKVLFLSHITSVTALKLPIENLILKAKIKGIITIIDGAHVPGHIKLNLNNLYADFYTGNLHKWLFVPKGSAFLYVSQLVRYSLKPFLISWGTDDFFRDGAFIEEVESQGTRDSSAFLSTIAALQFHKEYCTLDKKQDIYENLKFISQDFRLIFKTEPIVKELHPELQFYAHPLPPDVDVVSLKNKLLRDYNIEIPISEQNGRNYIRVSLQIYNTDDDVIRLMRALRQLV